MMSSSERSGMLGNIPVTRQPGSITSPYLNFDPSYVTQSDSQYIVPEGTAPRRGRFEMAFYNIGSAVFAGGALGGASGCYAGLRESAGLPLKARSTQLVNFVAKRGASTAQTFGVVALMYSGLGVILSKARGEEDSINTLVAATLTGLAYTSTAGMKKCLRGGAIGLGAASAYCLYSSYGPGKSQPRMWG